MHSSDIPAAWSCTRYDLVGYNDEFKFYLSRLLLQGGGLAYGTKEGKLRILRHDPRPEARTLATCQQPRGLQDELREAESAYEDDVLL